MKDITLVAISIVVILLITLIVKTCMNTGAENLYPTGTYVNTPSNYGVYPNTFGTSNYFNSYDWTNHVPDNPYLRYLTDAYANRSASQVGLNQWNPQYNSWYNQWNPLPYGPPLANVPNSNAPIPYGNPVPLNTIRWSGMGGPMLTSIKSPKDYAIGQWVNAGTAYTDNPNDFTYGSVRQLNLDPGRELFRYSIIIDGQAIPLTLPPYQNRLEDGDRFKVQGMEGKGDFIFNEADKYQYVYT